jgi:hypothetical protein
LTCGVVATALWWLSFSARSGTPFGYFARFDRG